MENMDFCMYSDDNFSQMKQTSYSNFVEILEILADTGNTSPSFIKLWIYRDVTFPLTSVFNFLRILIPEGKKKSCNNYEIKLTFF